MALLENPELRKLLAQLTVGMLEYMTSGNASYTEDDVDRCRNILVSYTEQLERAKNREESQALVKATVLKLNNLNESTGAELIETDQREAICGFITKAGAIKGFNSENEDVTERWRQW